MQTFIVKLGCLCLFGFIFFAAYQSSSNLPASNGITKLPTLPSAVLVSSKSGLDQDATALKATAEQIVKHTPSRVKYN